MYSTLYYFTHSTQCVFSKIKTNRQSVLLHLVVNKVELLGKPANCQYSHNLGQLGWLGI